MTTVGSCGKAARMAEGAIESVCHSQISSARLGRPEGNGGQEADSKSSKLTGKDDGKDQVGNHPELRVEAEVNRAEGRKLDALTCLCHRSSS